MWCLPEQVGVYINAHSSSQSSTLFFFFSVPWRDRRLLFITAQCFIVCVIDVFYLRSNTFKQAYWLHSIVTVIFLVNPEYFARTQTSVHTFTARRKHYCVLLPHWSFRDDPLQVPLRWRGRFNRRSSTDTQAEKGHSEMVSLLQGCQVWGRKSAKQLLKTFNDLLKSCSALL